MVLQMTCTHFWQSAYCQASPDFCQSSFSYYRYCQPQMTLIFNKLKGPTEFTQHCWSTAVSKIVSIWG
jgi:hypothetical protein